MYRQMTLKGKRIKVRQGGFAGKISEEMPLWSVL